MDLTQRELHLILNALNVQSALTYDKLKGYQTSAHTSEQLNDLLYELEAVTDKLFQYKRSQSEVQELVNDCEVLLNPDIGDVMAVFDKRTGILYEIYGSNSRLMGDFVVQCNPVHTMNAGPEILDIFDVGEY